MVSSPRFSTVPVIVTTDSRRRLDRREGGIGGIDDALGQPVMVAQVDEHKLPVIALAVDPSGQADWLSDIGPWPPHVCERKACTV